MSHFLGARLLKRMQRMFSDPSPFCAFRWIQYLCSLKYASGLSMIYEFGECESGIEQDNCDNVLERNNVSPDDDWWFWLAMCGLFVVFRLGALLLLKKRATNFS